MSEEAIAVIEQELEAKRRMRSEVVARLGRARDEVQQETESLRQVDVSIAELSEAIVTLKKRGSR